MPISFSTASGQTTITLTETAPTIRMQNTIGAAANWFWNHGMGNHGENGEITFDSLTWQQKLNIIEAFILRSVNDAARNFNNQAAASAAGAASDADAAINLHL